MRILAYILTQRRFLLFALLGLFFFLQVRWMVPFYLFTGLALLSAVRIATRPNLDRKLRLRREKKRHGITRKLTRAEKTEILALDTYTHALREAGVSAEELLREPLEQAWRLIHRSGLNDATASLRAFRESLPTLLGASSGATEQERAADLQARLRHEVALINAAEREIRAMESRAGLSSGIGSSST